MRCGVATGTRRRPLDETTLLVPAVLKAGAAVARCMGRVEIWAIYYDAQFAPFPIHTSRALAHTSKSCRHHLAKIGTTDTKYSICESSKAESRLAGG